MSVSGSMVLFSDSRRIAPRAAAECAWRLSGARMPSIASVTLGGSNEWASLRAGSVDDDDDNMELLDHKSGEYEFEHVMSITNGKDLVSLHMGVCPLLQSVGAAVARDIPEPIRGDYVSSEPIINIGPHDIIEPVPNSMSYRRLARATFSFGFFGYSTPHNCRVYPELFFALPEVVEVKRQLELVVGPLQQAGIWDV